MKILKVNGQDKDFFELCKKLEDYQYKLIPIIKEKGYTLTDNLQDITGFVLYIDNNPVASIGLKESSKDVCEIVRVFVCDEYRGKGYATLLFKEVEGLAKTLGYKKAEIVAWCKAKPALELYKKLGYTQTEEKISEWFGGDKYVELFKYF